MMRFRRSKGTSLIPRVIADFNRTILLIEDPDSLQASVAVRLQEIFGPQCVLILHSEESLDFTPDFNLGFSAEEIDDVRFERRGPLARWLVTNESPLIIDTQPGIVECLSENERAILARLRVAVCLPLLVLNRLTGIVLLGSREGEWRLQPDQQELLQALSGQIGLALENAILHREQRERLKRLYRAERLAAAGQLAAGVAHEIRNPLTSIRSTIQYVLPSYSAGDSRHDLLEELISEVDRIDRIVNDLMSLGRPSEFKPGAVDILQVLEHSLLLIGPQARKQSVEIDLEPSSRPLILQADEGQLRQVFLNLFLNSLQAMPDGGRLQISVGRSRLDGSGRESVEIEIEDSGVGIPEEHLDKVFDPFFTLKKEGTGLGLSVCFSIVQQHGGDMELRSQISKGTSVVVHLPCSATGQQGRTPGSQESEGEK